MNVIWAAATHQGRVRQNNEDAVHPAHSGSSSTPAVLMVADGMGGHVGGEVASRLAVEAAAGDHSDASQRMRAANQAIRDEIERQPGLRGMGTTLTLVEFDPSGLLRFGHIGDSRAYLLRDGEMVMLTSDHTVVAEYVRSGSISEEEAAVHPQRSMLSRALGVALQVRPDFFEVAAAPGDRVLLCSDGVSSMLSDSEIFDRLKQGTAEEAAWGLVEDANRAGGLDNITALVLDLVETA